MTRRRRSHTVHRFRVISRCPTCGVKLLSGCSYKTRSGGACIETRVEPALHRFDLHPDTGDYRSAFPTVQTVDLPREARRIFGKMLAPGIGIGLGD